MKNKCIVKLNVNNIWVENMSKLYIYIDYIHVCI